MNSPPPHVAPIVAEGTHIWTFRRSCTQHLRVKKVAHPRQPNVGRFRHLTVHSEQCTVTLPGALPTRIRSGLDVNQTGGRPASPSGPRRGNFACVAGLFLSPQAAPGGSAQSRAGVSREEPPRTQTDPSRCAHFARTAGG